MAASGILWTFGQQSAPTPGQALKVLTLGGWSAPFGRPRNGSIFNAGLSVRKQRTDYPGKNLAPTIHTFGTTKKPIDMHGRWMDRTIPQVGGAQQYIRAWQDFVADQVIVRMTWGSILSYLIFIDDIDLHVEGQGDVVWNLKADVLVDDQATVNAGIVTTSTPFDVASQMYKLMENLGGGASAVPKSVGTLLGMLNGLSDQLALLKSQINAPFAAIYNTCSALTSFETAISSDLTGLLSGVTAMQTGLLNLRQQTDFMMSSAQFLNSPDAVAISGITGGLLAGSDMLSIAAYKQQNDADVASMLGLLQVMQQQIDMQRRGTPAAAYIAQAGDTWEIAAERVLGSADNGRDIRDMNGIRYGELPIPGKSYTVPNSSKRSVRAGR
jgi:hypothetical protein